VAEGAGAAVVAVETKESDVVGRVTEIVAEVVADPEAAAETEAGDEATTDEAERRRGVAAGSEGESRNAVIAEEAGVAAEIAAVDRHLASEGEDEGTMATDERANGTRPVLPPRRRPELSLH
jgi:hypothetical protein